MFDLAINHCSRENLWFATLSAAERPAVTIFTDAVHDRRKSSTAKKFALLTDVHTYRGVKRVWTTFSDDQIN